MDMMIIIHIHIHIFFMPVLRLFKPIGKTPMETIEEYKRNANANEIIINKISYAGRLDPMAEGKLLVLTNEDCQNQNLYHNLNKTYNFELLLGITTDTYDTLGLITNNNNKNTDYALMNIMDYIPHYIGKHIQPYPPYSSARVDGHPLWYYASNDLLNTIDIPEKTIEIYSAKIIYNYAINSDTLKSQVIHNINKISSKYDFRQNAIIKCWQSIAPTNYHVINIEMSVSSGTYIRGICQHIGEFFGIPTMALSINRIEI
jgi:tRNA pseudouridine(55) synthase